MSHYEKAIAGGPIRPSASAYNALIDLLNAPDGINALRRALGNQPAFCRIKNNTGATLGRFNVVKLGTFNLSDTSNVSRFVENMALGASIPVTADYKRAVRIGITEGSISNGGIDRVICGGVTLCKVNITSDKHTYARPTNNDVTQLTSDWWGQCKIVAQESTGTGVKWCLVEVGAFFWHSWLGKFGSSVAKGATGTLTMWEGTSTSAAATSATISSVYNRYVTSIASGKFVRVSWDNDGPEATAMEC